MLNNINIQEIRIAMFRQGLTNKKLAEEMGVAPASIGRKLNGKSEFTISESYKLCDLLKLDPYQIFFASYVPNKQHCE